MGKRLELPLGIIIIVMADRNKRREYTYHYHYCDVAVVLIHCHVIPPMAPRLSLKTLLKMITEIFTSENLTNDN